MTKVVGNWVKEDVSGTPGTALTLTLVAKTGFARVQDIPELTVGATVRYVIEDGSNKEFGLGTRQAGSTFDRTTPQATLDAGTYDNTSPTRISLTSSAQLYLTSGDVDWTEAEQVAFITGATYTTIQHAHNIINSTGLVGSHTITDDADGTITVSAGSGFIRATDSDVAELVTLDWSAEAGANVTLIDNDFNYIYVEYNSGSPQIIATVTKRTDRNTNIALGTVYRAGTVLHITTATALQVGAHTSKMDMRLFELDPFARASGAVISETGNRSIAITAGSFWYGLDNFTTAAKDTNVADTFVAYYSDGAGGFTAITAQTQMNNTQYDDGSGTLATLANNRYGVCWVYISVEGDLYVVFGTGSYTLVDAEAATLPTSVPPHFEEHSRIVGKVIVLKSATNLQAVESAFATTFTTGLPTDHGDLIGLADDDHSQYLLVDGTRAATKFEYTGEIYKTGATLNGSAITNHVNLGAGASITGTAAQAYDYCTIGGGLNNEAPSDRATCAGGEDNIAGSNYGVVSGGKTNTISVTAYACNIGGGDSNNILGSNNYNTIGGGAANTANAAASEAVISGGRSNQVSGQYSAVPGGRGNRAQHLHSVAMCGGSYTRANYDVVIGATNTATPSVANNTLRFQGIGGNIRIDGALSCPEADIATMVEWADGNPNTEDRVGYAVSLIGGKLIKGGTNIVGIISSTPAVIGNAAPNGWVGKYLRDNMKRTLMTEYTLLTWWDGFGVRQKAYESAKGTIYDEYPQPTAVNGRLSAKTPLEPITRETVEVPTINPVFDIAQEYIPRDERKEWATLGVLGQIVMITAEPITTSRAKISPISGELLNLADGDSGFPLRVVDVIEVIDSTTAKVFYFN